MATKKKKTSGSKRTGSSRKRPVSRKSSSARQFSIGCEVLLFVILGISVILFIGNIGKGGVIGDGLSFVFFGLFGLLSYVFPFVLFFVAAFLIANLVGSGSGPMAGRAILKSFAVILLFVFLCVFSWLVYDSSIDHFTDAFMDAASRKTGGGVVGYLIGHALESGFGIWGAYVIDIIVMIFSLVLITERSFFKGVSKGSRKVYDSAKQDAQRKRQAMNDRRTRRMDQSIRGVSLDTDLKAAKKAPNNLKELDLSAQNPDAKKKEKKAEPVQTAEIAEEMTGKQSEDFWNQQPPVIHMPSASPEAAEGAPVPEAEQEQQPARRTRKTRASAQEMASEIQDVESEIQNQELVSAQKKRPYIYPDIKLLKKGDPRQTGDSRAHLQEMSARLQRTLETFGVNARVTNVICGPSVTQYEIHPEMGVKVNKIVNLADDIKLNLAVSDIRIEAPIPGKAAVGIEVPNKENVTVAFRDLVESKEFQSQESRIAFCAGKDIAGNVIVADIAKMPHLLIAGATGSGKSVCINTIIMSILYKADPEDVKLIMIDPKVVELSVYNGIPHLLIPVVTDPKKAAGALQWAVAEMTDRYNKFAEYGVRDMKGYNQKVASIADIEDENKPKKMPQIVVIVDELADLMMVASGDVEDAICRLAQLARAAGIHLIIATQRPSVNVITGLIKANMPSRIAFSVTSNVDSRTILDMKGAEKLLGKGDMLFYPQGYTKPLRVQGAFVSDKEVSDVVQYIIDNNGKVAYNSEIEDQVKKAEPSMAAGGFTESASDRDAYFKEAGVFIIEKEKGSIGMLQRMFKIGFNRAARIMDQLEEAGVVGPEEGTKPRRVLMTLEEFEAVCSEE